MHTARFDQFTWNHHDRTLVTEASDIGIVGALPWPYKITVMSITNIDFTREKIEKDNEGDTERVIYISKGLNNPVKMIVFND